MRDGTILKHGLVLILNPESIALIHCLAFRIPHSASRFLVHLRGRRPLASSYFPGTCPVLRIPSQYAAPEAIVLISALHNCSLCLFLL
jgi:hypothetical protein